MIQKKFRQSQDLDGYEQVYYDRARQMMLDNGCGSLMDFIKNELPGIEVSQLAIDKTRFEEILRLAYRDYIQILFHGY